MRRMLLIALMVPVLAGCGGDAARTPAKPVACADVPFTAGSDDVAAEIRATGVSCDEARALVRDADGAPGPQFRRYVCASRRVEGEAVLVHTFWRCTRNDVVITRKRY